MIELEVLPGGRHATAVAVNDDGVVVGTCNTADDTEHAVSWREGRITDLGTLGGWNSGASGVNNRGDVVGWSETGPGRTGRREGFLWSDGRMTELGSLGGGDTMAEAVNDDGWVVGCSRTAEHMLHAFVWKAGEMTDLGTLERGVYQSSQAHDVDNQGRIVGHATVDNMNAVAVIWEDGEIRQLGDRFGTAVAINGRGEVAGGLYSGVECFVWSQDRFTVFGRVQSTMSVGADGIDDRGRVLGHADGWSFIWHDGEFDWSPSHLATGRTSVRAISGNGRFAVGSRATGPGAYNERPVLWTLD